MRRTNTGDWRSGSGESQSQRVSEADTRLLRENGGHETERDSRNLHDTH